MKYLILFVVLLVACQPSENLEESICVDRCLRIEGTIINGWTNEPLANLPLKVEYIGSIFSNFGFFTKARVQTDANGFYSTSIEVFDEELKGNGIYSLTLENEDNVYKSNNIFSIFQRGVNTINIFDTYTADYKLHQPAYIKYDMDGLAKLKKFEKALIQITFKVETLFGKISDSNFVRFDYLSEEDRGQFKVPAGVPIKLTVSFRDTAGSSKIIREEPSIVLEYNEEYEVEVEL